MSSEYNLERLRESAIKKNRETIKKEIDKLLDDQMMKLVMDGLAKHDSRYIGNVGEKEARKMFPEMFNDN